MHSQIIVLEVFVNIVFSKRNKVLLTWVNPSPGLKLVGIMLETWNLVCKYTHICSFRKYTFSTKTLLILLMSAFFLQKIGLWVLQIGNKSENDNDITIYWHDVIVNFLCCFVSLVNFSYWSKFHVIIITGSGVMAIYFYKGLTRNLEIRYTPLGVFPNIWRLGQITPNLAWTSLMKYY